MKINKTKNIDKEGVRTLAHERGSGPKPDVLDHSTTLPITKFAKIKIYNH